MINVNWSKYLSFQSWALISNHTDFNNEKILYCTAGCKLTGNEYLNNFIEKTYGFSNSNLHKTQWQTWTNNNRNDLQAPDWTVPYNKFRCLNVWRDQLSPNTGQTSNGTTYEQQKTNNHSITVFWLKTCTHKRKAILEGANSPLTHGSWVTAHHSNNRNN